MHSAVQIREACQRLRGSAETFPFGLDVLVLKVGGKIYALMNLDDSPLSLSLKCDPLRSEALRQAHHQIVPGYHLNKRHWNTLTLDGSLPGALVSELLNHSHELVVASLSRAQRAELD